MIGAPLSQEEPNKRSKEVCANAIASVQQLRSVMEAYAEEGRSVQAELARMSRLPPEEQEQFKDYIEKVRVWVEKRKLVTAETRSTVQGMLSIVEGIKQDQLARRAWQPPHFAGRCLTGRGSASKIGRVTHLPIRPSGETGRTTCRFQGVLSHPMGSEIRTTHRKSNLCSSSGLVRC
jgi:hypothetical protein